MNQETTKSKGLVAAIIIIAVVIVAAAIATPIYLKSLEKDRRTEDVAMAEAIADTVISAADTKQGDIVVGTPVEATPDTVPDMTEQPFAKGSVVGKGEPFIYYYVKQGNSCAIYIGDDRTFNLNNASQAQAYINK